MKKKANRKNTRSFLKCITGFIAVMSFICMAGTNDQLEGWWIHICSWFAVFVISTVLTAILDEPRLFYRHLAAIMICFGAFIYRTFSIDTNYTKKFNRALRKAGSYKNLYLWAIDKYDEVEYKHERYDH